MLFRSMVEKNPLTPFGKQVKHRLINLDKTNGWLVEEVKKRVDTKFDSSFMAKILNGKVENSAKKELINEILSEEEARQNAAESLG